MYLGARHHPLVCHEGAAWMKKNGMTPSCKRKSYWFSASFLLAERHLCSQTAKMCHRLDPRAGSQTSFLAIYQISNMCLGWKDILKQPQGFVETKMWSGKKVRKHYDHKYALVAQRNPTSFILRIWDGQNNSLCCFKTPLWVIFFVSFISFIL